MALKVSAGMRNKLLATGSLASTLAAGFIKIYSGTAPTNADNAIGSAGANTLLCTISIDGLGTGINMDTAAASGVLAKAPGESWKGTNAASGLASFYRHTAVGDTGTLSTTEARLQGAIATANAEMNFTNTTLTASADQNVDYYSVTLPSL